MQKYFLLYIVFFSSNLDASWRKLSEISNRFYGCDDDLLDISAILA